MGNRRSFGATHMHTSKQRESEPLLRFREKRGQQCQILLALPPPSLLRERERKKRSNFEIFAPLKKVFFLGGGGEMGKEKREEISSYPAEISWRTISEGLLLNWAAPLSISPPPKKRESACPKLNISWVGEEKEEEEEVEEEEEEEEASAEQMFEHEKQEVGSSSR